MELSADDQAFFARLLEQRTGQQLQPGRRWRLDTALQAVLKSHAIEDVPALVRRLRLGDPTLAEAVAWALLNHETFFFRDQPAFTHLLSVGLPALREARAAQRRLRIWSAGCSTGQEPYSLAFAFARDPKAWEGWQIDIVATDISPIAIDRARAGVYSQFEAQRGLPVQELVTLFEPAGDSWRVCERMRQKVRFSRHSLFDAPPPGGPFDLVLCRNVLFYFAADRRRMVFAHLASAMAADGRLMLGAAETVIGQTDDFAVDPDQRGLYRRRDGAEPTMAKVA